MMWDRFPWMGVIFWIGVFTWFSIMLWTRYLRERERQQTLRAIAASGRPLEPEALEKLFPARYHHRGDGPSSPEAASRGLMIGGIVAVFAGMGILIGAQFISRIAPDALWGMSTGGVVVSFVGLGLLTASWAHRRVLKRDESAARDVDVR